MSEPIKPKEITLKSKVLGDDVERVFRLGRYPALDSVELYMMALEVLTAMAKPMSENNVPPKKAREFMTMACCYVDARMPNGEFIRLNKEVLVNAHVPDGEMLFSLVLQLHNYNSFFLNSEKLLKTSLSMIDKVKLQASKMLTQYLPPSKAKSSPRSKS